MKLEAKARLVADEAQRRDKRNAIQKSIDNVQKKIDNIRKTLPSQNNSMKVSPANQATKRQQILQEEIKKQNLRKQKLRTKEDYIMYSFLIEAKPFTEERYDFFTYTGAKPVAVDFRGTTYQIVKGMRFGVRPSSNGKSIRLIFPENHTRVFTIDQATANALAKHVKA